MQITDCRNDGFEFKSVFEIMRNDHFFEERRREDQVERHERQSRIETLIQIPIPTEIPKWEDFTSDGEYFDALEDFKESMGADDGGNATLIGLDGELHGFPSWLVDIMLSNHKLAVESGRSPILERDKETGFCRILPSVTAELEPILDVPAEWAERFKIESNDAEYPLVRDVLGYGFDAYYIYVRNVGPIPAESLFISHSNWRY
jgi:hypothetical protein